MSCDKFKDLIMGYVDDELDAHEKELLESHITDCGECSKELSDFKKLKSITDDINLYEPEDKIFDEYWSSIYNRIERSIGWILLSVCGMVVLFYGGFLLVEEIIKDETIGLVFKVGIVGFIAALSILLVSVLRERLRFRSKDRYKNVNR